MHKDKSPPVYGRVHKDKSPPLQRWERNVICVHDICGRMTVRETRTT